MKIFRFVKKLLITAFILFTLLNIVAIFHAYRFTHFDPSSDSKTSDPGKLSTVEKFQTIISGIKNPRPKNDRLPEKPFEVVNLKSNSATLEAWYIPVKEARGTVIICHGYGGHKSSMLDKSKVFNKLGFNTFLIDFMGSGGSEGNKTTIGFFESEQVNAAFGYLKDKEEKNVVLFGTSMGAVAIMKAVSDHDLTPDAVIIECPFGSMLETVKARFEMLNVPSFPMAELLVFWGGTINGFNAFEHNPESYAKEIEVSVLLLHGAKDEKVSIREINRIFNNLKGPKKLNIYPEAGHENYLVKYRDQWTKDVAAFLEN